MLKKIITVTAILFSSIHPSASADSLDSAALVQSIGDVETGGKYWRIGAAGERSMYQIKHSVWKQYSRVPFWMASEKSYQVEAARVAGCYISDIIDGIHRRNVTVKNIAMRWNGGPNKSHYSRQNISYATRVSNLYESYKNIKSAVLVAAAPLKIKIDLGIESVDSVIKIQSPLAPKIIISTERSFYSPVLAAVH